MSNTKFQDLNLSNGFLFPAALEDPITCKLVLECIIEENIGELAVKVEYTKPYNSEFKCIRLDVYAKDVITSLSYNLEMQNKNEYNLPLRSRYYQAHADVGNLKPGEDYMDLTPLYVIFICNFDPFDQKLYRYTFAMQCEERKLMLNDGVKRIFLSTKGENKEEVPDILCKFLGYLNDSTDGYIEQNANEQIRELHGRIKELKQNRDVEARYMHYLYVDKIIEEKEALLKQQEEELKQQEEELKQKEDELQKKDMEMKEIIKTLIIFALEKYDDFSELLRERINKEENMDVLKSMKMEAIQASSAKQFEEKIANL